MRSYHRAPPLPTKHEKSKVSVAFFESTLFLYVVDLATSLLEFGRLTTPTISNQCIAFLCLSVSEHGFSKILQADNECSNLEFRKLRDDWKIKVNIVSVNHLEASEKIERANRTLRTTNNRLHANRSTLAPGWHRC